MSSIRPVSQFFESSGYAVELWLLLGLEKLVPMHSDPAPVGDPVFGRRGGDAIPESRDTMAKWTIITLQG